MSFKLSKNAPGLNPIEARVSPEPCGAHLQALSHLSSAVAAGTARLLEVLLFFIHENFISERVALGRLRAGRETLSATHFILNNFPRKFPSVSVNVELTGLIQNFSGELGIESQNFCDILT